MSKKRILILGLALVIAVGSFTYFLHSTSDQNKLCVTVDAPLYSDKIRIDKGFYSISEDSDENLVKMGLSEIVYDSSKAKGFETICGENDFLVVYDNEFYTIVRHFIPNDFYDGKPEPHTYNFNFKKNGEKINLTLNIEGQDGEKIQRVMSKISEAGNNIWGVKKK